MAAQIEVGDDLEIMRLHDDPVYYFRIAFGIDPTEQQTDFLNEIRLPGAKVSIASGHGTGKSTSFAGAALWFLDTHIDALVPCTAPTAHQLEDVLWREMYGLYNRMPDEMKGEISFNSERVRRRNSNGMIVARTARPENPDALQGFHAPEILFLIDEAAGVADAIFEVARGALSTPNARVAMAGNPTKLTGYFHSSHHMNRDSWTRLRFSCLESPLVDPSYAADIIREYGEDSDMYRVRVLGKFPHSGIYNLIPLELVEAAMERTAPPDWQEYMPIVFGVDPAYEGTDRSSIVMRQGLFAKVLFAGRGLRTDELAVRANTLAHKYSPQTIFVDKTGVGAGVLDQLRNLGAPAVGIAFSNAPDDGERFTNKRIEEQIIRSNNIQFIKIPFDPA